MVSVEYISIRSGVSISLSYRRKDTSIWVTWNEDNVSEWGDMTIRELLFQWVCTMTNQHNVLVYYKADLIIISLEINLFLPWYSWKMSKQQWLTHSYIISQGGNGSFISSILLIIVSIRFIFLSSEGARLINMTRSVEFEVSCPCSRFFCFLHIYCVSDIAVIFSRKSYFLILNVKQVKTHFESPLRFLVGFVLLDL